jgi:hypothetical protein
MTINVGSEYYSWSGGLLLECVQLFDQSSVEASKHASVVHYSLTSLF